MADACTPCPASPIQQSVLSSTGRSIPPCSHHESVSWTSRKRLSRCIDSAFTLISLGKWCRQCRNGKFAYGQPRQPRAVLLFHHSFSLITGSSSSQRQDFMLLRGGKDKAGQSRTICYKWNMICFADNFPVRDQEREATTMRLILGH